MLKITTNNVPRDYTTDVDGTSMFRYRGTVYDLADFTTLPPDSQEARAGWHGGAADTVWSGVLVKLDADNETVIVGRWSE